MFHLSKTYEQIKNGENVDNSIHFGAMSILFSFLTVVSTSAFYLLQTSFATSILNNLLFLLLFVLVAYIFPVLFAFMAIAHFVYQCRLNNKVVRVLAFLMLGLALYISITIFTQVLF